MNLDKLKNNMKQGTPGPWDSHDGGLVVLGGTAPKKAMFEHKNTVCHLPKFDCVTGLMTEKERQANTRRIETLPELEEAYVKARALLKKFNQDSDNQKLKEEYQKLVEV